MSGDLGVLEGVLGHRFVNRELLERALTHKSCASERNPEEPSTDNEQLEFLGDAIVGFVVSDTLIARIPAYHEGRVSKLKAQLVSASPLHAVAMVAQFAHTFVLITGESLISDRVHTLL